MPNETCRRTSSLGRSQRRKSNRCLVATFTAISSLAFAAPCYAATFGGPDVEAAVRDEHILLVDDAAHGLEHVLYSARVDTKAAALELVIPTPTRAAIEGPTALDIARAMHVLAASYDHALGALADAEPAPWNARGVTLSDGRTVRASDATTAIPWLDRSFTTSLADRQGWLAVFSVSVPPGRIEAATPTVRLTFPTTRPELVWTEPAAKVGAGASGPGSVSYEGVSTEGSRTPSPETIAKVLRSDPAATLACFDASEAPTKPLPFMITASVDRRGSITKLNASPTSDLTSCIANALRSRPMPRMDEPWSFRANAEVRPPALRSRRTHLYVLGPERVEPMETRRDVLLVKGYEADEASLTAAFDASTRSALGLPAGKRLWMTEWVDRSANRAGAHDLAFRRMGLPEPGTPGTREYAAAKLAPESSAGASTQANTRASRHTRQRRTLFAIGAASLALAWWLSRSERGSA